MVVDFAVLGLMAVVVIVAIVWFWARKWITFRRFRQFFVLASRRGDL